MDARRDGVLEAQGMDSDHVDDSESETAQVPIVVGEFTAQDNAELNAPSKQNAYTLLRCWQNLQKLIDDFDDDVALVKSETTSADKKSYNLCVGKMKKFFVAGKNAQPVDWEAANKVFVLKNALSAISTFESTFAKFADWKHTKYKVHVTGPKSAAYYLKVIIPFLDDLKRVEHEPWLVNLAKKAFRDLNKESVRIGKIADDCRAKLKEMKLYPEEQSTKSEAVTANSNVQTLNVVGAFAQPPVVEQQSLSPVSMSMVPRK